MQTAANPLTTVTKALYTELVTALDVIFPSEAGNHHVLVDQMLDYEVIDADAFQQGRTHVDNLVVMGTRPNLDHESMVAMLTISGMAHTLGFVVQARQL